MDPLEPRPSSGPLRDAWLPPAIRLDAPVGLGVKPLFDEAFSVENILSPADCSRLIDAMESSRRLAPVSVNGLPGCGLVGSRRVTAWEPALADQLWGRLLPLLPAIRLMSPTTPTDWHWPVPCLRWRPCGVSPVLRFMRYDAGGQHHAHYDQSYSYPDGRRTLMSFVLYLTSTPPGAGGRTRFVRDGQEATPIEQRRHDDWSREALESEVLFAFVPTRGAALVFDHRRCHDIELYRGATPRIIVRGDIIFSPA